MARIIHADLPRSERGNDPNDHRDDPGYLARMRLIVPKLDPPPRERLFITEDELTRAELTPKCIVENHLYADLAQRVAPGGTGKTTLTLWEAIHIVLGIDLYGCKVVTPGWVLIITAEDRRERLVARLRLIMDAMELSATQRAKVLRGVLPWDVTGEQAKLVQEMDGNLMLTKLPDQIIEAYSDDPPVLVEIDPLVSFGAAEQRVNDNEQALVSAARRIIKGLDCCVRFTHHTGKANAREKSIDQYAGRGGSALPDGSRMTVVLQAWAPTDQGPKPPETLEIEPTSSVTIYARPKLSYCPPNLPLIWIKRDGYVFAWATDIQRAPEAVKMERADQLIRFIQSELRAERYHTKNSIREQTVTLGMSQRQIREAVEELFVSSRLMMRPMPESLRHGRRTDYLCPIEASHV
jgi:regulatory protein RepA